MNERGLLLFAHGARDPAWARPFEAVASRVQWRDPGMQVSLAFLEFMTPDLLAAGDALVARGCAEITVVPLFLGAGGHVRKDLPRLMQELQARHTGVAWALAPAIGEIEAVVDAMADAAWQQSGVQRPAATPSVAPEAQALHQPSGPERAA